MPFSISSSLFSILPAHLSYIEYYAVRLFLLLAFLTIGPWLFLIVYDFLLYLFRLVLFEMPIVGGRARGELRPRAPSVGMHADGRRRSRGVSLLMGVPSSAAMVAEGGERSRGVRKVLQEEEREMRSWEVVDEDDGEGKG